MQKTRFAGLTQLDPGESIQTDNASFQWRNPSIIDRLLEIGAVTHRHDAHAALASPDIAPSGLVVNSGGAIPAGTTLFIGYTLRDHDQGETTLSSLDTESTESPLDTPGTPPDGVIDYTGGGLVADTYYYAISVLDAEGGETPLSDSISVEREPGFASGQVQLSNLLASVAAVGGAAWRLWRAVGGSDWFYIASGASDTFTDDGAVCADCSLMPVDDSQNFTNGDNAIYVTVPSGGLMDQASAFSVYMSTTGDFSGTLMGTFSSDQAGQPILFTDLIAEDASPPEVSSCIPGASKIDPDTELIDWHWKRPVATEADLPVDAEEGDVRVVLDTGNPWRFADGAWGQWVVGGIEVTPEMNVQQVTFQASGGAEVAVAAGGPNEAVVTVYAPSSGAGGGGTGDGSVYELYASGASAAVERPANITFVGSGGTLIEVEQNGASGIVTIQASGLVGPEGPRGPSGTIGGIQDENVDLPQRSKIDFVGSGVTATDDAANDRTVVTIPGGGGGGATVVTSIVPATETNTVPADDTTYAVGPTPDRVTLVLAASALVDVYAAAEMENPPLTGMMGLFLNGTQLRRDDDSGVIEGSCSTGSFSAMILNGGPGAQIAGNAANPLGSRMGTPVALLLEPGTHTIELRWKHRSTQMRNRRIITVSRPIA